MVVLRDDPPLILRGARPQAPLVDSAARGFGRGVVPAGGEDGDLHLRFQASRLGCGCVAAACCEQIMERLGFLDWQYFFGSGHDPYRRQIPRDHAMLLRTNVAPLLILEDDIEIAHWRARTCSCRKGPSWRTGGFRSGDSRGIRNARLVGLEPLLAWRYGYLPIDADWMRIFGMRGSHAILYLFRYDVDVADQFERK